MGAASWWDLPGPAGFLDSLEGDLRGQCNLLLRLPRHAPPGLVEALGQRVRRNEQWLWRVIPEPEGLRPIEAIQRALDPDGAAWSAGELAESTSLSGYVVCVPGVGRDHNRAWLSFLRAYQHAYRNSGAVGPQLCVLVQPGDTGDVREVGLAVHTYCGVADTLDARIFAAQLLRGSKESGRRRELRSELVVALAGGDPELAVQMVEWEWDDLLSPARKLAAYGRSRGWTPGGVRTCDWASGTAETLDGRAVTHTAALAVRGACEDLQRRVWKAQVRVLFPFLEEERERLCKQVANLLELPFESSTGTIDDPRDIELGHLLYLVGRRARPELVRRLGILVNMRHALAHLESVGSGCLNVLDG